MNTNANVDFCGIVKLLSALEGKGFSKPELRKIAQRIAVNTGVSIVASF